MKGKFAGILGKHKVVLCHSAPSQHGCPADECERVYLLSKALLWVLFLSKFLVSTRGFASGRCDYSEAFLVWVDGNGNACREYRARVIQYSPSNANIGNGNWKLSFSQMCRLLLADTCT